MCVSVFVCDRDNDTEKVFRRKEREMEEEDRKRETKGGEREQTYVCQQTPQMGLCQFYY